MKKSSPHFLCLCQIGLPDGIVPVEVSVVVEKTLEDTAHVLSQLALDYNAELVVVGSTGKNWIERLLLGSVSHYLITKLHLPVCVVPGGAQPADEEKSSSG